MAWLEPPVVGAYHAASSSLTANVSGHQHRLQNDLVVERVVQLVGLRSGRAQTSMTFGTVAGSTVQCGSELATAQTPKLYAPGVAENALALSPL